MGSTASNNASQTSGKNGDHDRILSVHSPALLDLGHGTVRHRNIAKIQTNPDVPTKTKTGYFYHPKLDDYSEDAVVNPEDAFKFYYVFKGPKKDQSKKLYYVYGTNMNSKDAGIKHESYKPQGKGYNWPESFRKANNLYYELIFLEQDPITPQYADSISLDSDITFDSGNTGSTQSKEMIRMVLENDDNAEEIKRKLAVRLLVPAINIHIIFNKTELSNEDIIADLRSPEEGTWRQFSILLRLS